MGSHHILVFKLVFILTMENSDTPRSKRPKPWLLNCHHCPQQRSAPLSNDANSKAFTNSEPESEHVSEQLH